MLNPFQKPELIEAKSFMRMPDKIRNKQHTRWSVPNRQGVEIDSFLEGPSFDRDGNFFFVDIPFGRIFCITNRGEWELVMEYDGWPNGLKIHKDGRMFLADYKRGILMYDPKKGEIEPIVETVYSEGFKGCNDLHFASNGDLYFTDQGQTGVLDPTGRGVPNSWRQRPAGEARRQRSQSQRHYVEYCRETPPRRGHAHSTDLALPHHG